MAIGKSFHSISYCRVLLHSAGQEEVSRDPAPLRVSPVIWQNWFFGKISTHNGRIRREMPRAFIWWVYCRGPVDLARQEWVLGNSAPPQITSLNPPNSYNSATNWRSMLILVSLAARAGLPKSRFAVAGVFLRMFSILPGPGTSPSGT